MDNSESVQEIKSPITLEQRIEVFVQQLDLFFASEKIRELQEMLGRKGKAVLVPTKRPWTAGHDAVWFRFDKDGLSSAAYPWLSVNQRVGMPKPPPPDWKPCSSADLAARIIAVDIPLYEIFLAFTK